MVSELINANPIVYEKKERRARSVPTAVEEYAVEPIDQQEVFDILSLQLFWYGLCTFKSTYYRGISKVVFRELGLDGHNYYYFLIVDIRVAPGSHASESAVNKQLNDKERVAAALENPNLVDMVDECLAPSYD
nr:protein AE7-like [Quercus suber]